MASNDVLFVLQLNDCLLYTSYYGSMFSLTVKHELPLAGMKFCVPQTEDYNNEFNIIATTRSFTLRARYVNGIIVYNYTYYLYTTCIILSMHIVQVCFIKRIDANTHI